MFVPANFSCSQNSLEAGLPEANDNAAVCKMYDTLGTVFVDLSFRSGIGVGLILW